jgi:hypothetical protein
LRMQTSFEIAETRKRERDIEVRPYLAKQKREPGSKAI